MILSRYIPWAVPKDNGLGVLFGCYRKKGKHLWVKDLSENPSRWSMRPLSSISYWKAWKKKRDWREHCCTYKVCSDMNFTFALWELTMTPHGRLRAGLRLKSSVASSTCPRCRFSMATRFLEMNDMVLVPVSWFTEHPAQQWILLL